MKIFESKPTIIACVLSLFTFGFFFFSCKKEESQIFDIRDNIVGIYSYNLEYVGSETPGPKSPQIEIIRDNSSNDIFINSYYSNSKYSGFPIVTATHLVLDSNIITFEIVPYLPDTIWNKTGINFDGTTNPKKPHGIFNLSDGTLNFAFNEKWYSYSEFKIKNTNCLYKCKK